MRSEARSESPVANREGAPLAVHDDIFGANRSTFGMPRGDRFSLVPLPLRRTMREPEVGEFVGTAARAGHDVIER
jgi:hypothetical protein